MIINTFKENWKTFCLASLSGLCILVSYDWLRSSTTPIFVKYFSSQLLPFATACMVFMAALTVGIYNKILSKIGPKWTFFSTSIGSSLLLFILFFLVSLEIKEAAFFLYMFRYIYVMLLVEQVWSFFNSKLDAHAIKILAGPMMGIISVGSALSGQVLKVYAKSIGTLNVIWIASIILLPSAFFMFKALEGLSLKKKKHEKNYFLGASLLKNKPILISLFFIVLFSQVFAATTTFRFDTAVTDLMKGQMDAQTSYYAGFYSKINFFSSIMQFIITPLVLNFMSLGLIHLFIPLLHLALAVLILFEPSLALISSALILFKVIDYSTYKAAKELLYVPFSKEVKYRAKQFIDVFGYRLGTGIISCAFALIKYLDSMTNGESGRKLFDNNFFSITSIIFVSLWLCFSILIFRSLRKKKI